MTLLHQIHGNARIVSYDDGKIALQKPTEAHKSWADVWSVKDKSEARSKLKQHYIRLAQNDPKKWSEIVSCLSSA
jgi:hypothetical protein